MSEILQTSDEPRASRDVLVQRVDGFIDGHLTGALVHTEEPSLHSVSGVFSRIT